jgi:hypothetical protein
VVPKPEPSSGDNKWADKQIESFTTWLNFAFIKANVSSVEIETVSEATPYSSEVGSDDAPSASAASCSLRTLMRKRLDAQIRQKALLAYHHESSSVPLFQLSEDIENGIITVREDKDVHSDIGLRKLFMELIFSYELPYLKLGLEVVFKDIITCKVGQEVEHCCDAGDAKWKKALKAYVEERLFADEKIQSRFTKQKLLFPEHQRELRAQLRTHLVKKFLALVLVLDKARLERLLGIPALFVATSDIKSSKAMLSAFCMEFLSIGGQGNFVRLLNTKKYSVHFEQSFVDEFDYRVSCLQVDLRDGVRLAKLVELLTKTDGLMAQLRVPAISFMQKSHNLNLALERAFGGTVEAGIDAKGVVEGNREATLFLLWKLQYKFERRTLTDPDLVRAEAQSIRKDMCWRGTIYNEDCVGAFAVCVPTRRADGSVTYPAVDDTPVQPEDFEDFAVGSPEDVQQQVALVDWCNAIATLHGVVVQDLTESLADGRALCLLIHYYHPSVLPISTIKKTFQNILAENAGEEEIVVTNTDMQRALDGERRNFVNLKNACRVIGGIPLMLQHYDSKNIPDAKTMTVFLGYLFSRLVESAEQVRAVIRLQRCYRKHAASRPRKLKTRVQTYRNQSKYRLRDFAIEKGVTDVGCTVVMSAHSAADMIKRMVRSYTARRVYARALLTKAAEDRERLLEEERWAEMSAREQARWEHEVELANQREAQLLQEEEQRLIAEAAEQEDALHQQAVFEQEELNRLLQQAREEAASAARLEVMSQAEEDLEKHRLALEETAKQVIQESALEIAHKEERLQKESRIRRELEERLGLLEDARFEAEEQVRTSELRLQELSEQLAEHENANEDLLEKLHLERQRREEAVEQAKVNLQEQEILLKSQLEEDIVRATRSNKAREAQVESEILVEREAKRELLERLETEAQARKELEARLAAIEEQRRAFEAEEQRRMAEKQRQGKLRAVCAVRIQAAWKCFFAKQNLIVFRKLGLQMQALVRGFLIRRKVTKLRAKSLQAKRNAAALKISKWFASTKARNALKASRRTAKRASICLASARLAKENKVNRVKLAAKTIFSFFVSYRPLRRAQMMNWGFARLAAVFRSNKTREYSAYPIKEIHSRLKAIKNRDQDNIGRRTLEAIKTLQTVKQVPQLLEACKMLVSTTEVSLECCAIFADSKSSLILFSTIRSCNRSSVHQELLAAALKTLLNVSRRDKLTSRIALSTDSVIVLVDLMQMFRDKPSIFCLTCELLCRLCASHQESKNVCKSADCRKRLDGIAHIIERKHRLDSRVANIGSAKIEKSTTEEAFVSTPKGKGSFLAACDPFVGIKHLLLLLDA